MSRSSDSNTRSLEQLGGTLRGRFVVLEGIDGAGTTTQTRILAERLRGLEVDAVTTAEPSSGAVGRLIRHLLGQVGAPPDPALMALLFAADRVDHLASEITPALSNGKWVIGDRYLWSSLAYQSLALPLGWVRELNDRAVPPDLTVVVDLDPEEAARRLEREGRSEEIFDRLELQRSIRAAYLELARAEKESPVAIVDGRPIADDVADRIWDGVKTHLGEALPHGS